MKIASNGSDIVDARAFRVNLGAAPQPPFPDVPGGYVPLSGRPSTIVHGTAPINPNVLRISPLTLDEPITLDQLAVVVSVAATGGTAAGYFALFARGADGVPNALEEDWSGIGSIDLTTGTGMRTLATPGLIIPAGSWGLGFVWTGTASGNPTVRTTTLVSNAIASSTADLTAISGWSAVAIGAVMPDPPTIGAAGTNGVSIFGRVV